MMKVNINIASMGATMMTTDRPRSPRAQSFRDLKAFIVTLLAGSYLYAWASFSAASQHAASNASLGTAVLGPRRSVWYADLPAESRPRLALPVGFELASVDVELPLDAPQARPVTRTLRIRTRSS